MSGPQSPQVHETRDSVHARVREPRDSRNFLNMAAEQSHAPVPRNDVVQSRVTATGSRRRPESPHQIQKEELTRRCLL